MNFRHGIFGSFSLALLLFLIPFVVAAQSPGGISAGLTAWFKADMGVTVAGGAATTWANQAANPNLVNVVQNGGASTLTTNMPRPFNFNPYMQFNNGCFNKAAASAFEDVVKGDLGSIFGVGTASSALVSITSNFTTSPCGGNRCNSGTGYSASEFGNTGVNWSTGGSINTTRANVWGLRASTAGTPQQQNTFNGFKNSGSCGSRRSGPYRFAIGSFIGYYYGTGRIAEVVCHNRQLNANEFARLESYLAMKYGVTLGNNANPVDYLSSNSIVLWNGSNTYQNRVTLMGRDDASGWHQKQSQSVHTGSMVAVYNRDAYAGAFPQMNADNTTGFATDGSFFAFGDNKLDTLINQCSPDGRWARMLRTWKVQVTGDAGTVTLAVQQAAVPPQATALIVSTDPGFTTGVTIVPLLSNGLERYASYTFTKGEYFTFGTLPMVLNGVTGQPVCDGMSDGTINLDPSGGAMPARFEWNTTPPQQTEDVTGLVPGAYTVTVTQANGCTFDSTLTVAANPPLFVHVTGMENTICTAVNGAIKAEGLGGTPPWQFSLDGGNYGAEGTFSGLATGNHTVSIKDRYGCLADTLVAVGNATYELMIDTATGNAWCDAGGYGGYIELQVMLGTLPFTYAWDNFPAVTGAKVSNIPKGRYNVTVTDANGCEGKISVDIEETPCCSIGIPNAFSPNGDGLNDEFLPAISQSFTNYVLSVFNRWGEQVFHSTSVSSGWNGMINGKACEAGTYFYHISYACKMDNKVVEKRGDIVLLR